MNIGYKMLNRNSLCVRIIKRVTLTKNYRSNLIFHSSACTTNCTIEDNSKSKSSKFSGDDPDSFGNLKISLEKVNKHKLQKIQKINAKQPNKMVLKLKSNEADTFGTLSDSKLMRYINDTKTKSREYTDQSDNSVFVNPTERKFRNAEMYLAEMKRLAEQKKLKEALDLFVDMKRNNITPIHATYTYMIGACGRTGYTEMAFKLLRQMTDRAFQPTPATLTGLFNSCAECPFPEYGLKMAKGLKQKIEQKNWLLTAVTYHSMIKAFGKCGDIGMAFQIVDEMAANDFKIDVTTYSFLLMSCITNKEAGFTHAVEVWRKMKARKCVPNLYSCNLILRAARDCGVGPEDVSCLLLQHWSSYLKRPYGFETKELNQKKPLLKLASPKHAFVDESSENIKSAYVPANEKFRQDEASTKSDIEYVDKTAIEKMTPKNSPSLLEIRPINGPLYTDIFCIKTSADRLALLGEAEGFLNYMKKIKVKPDIKTFTLLLECLPPNTEAEEQLVTLLENYKVQPDVDFFNMLMKRRNVRQDNFSARKVLLLVNKYALTPDIITFGVLALGCHTRNQFSILKNDMKKLGFSQNVEIIGAFLHNASKAMDFQYLQDVLKLMEQQNIKPNEKALRKVEETLELARQNIIDMEHGKEVKPVYKRKGFSQSYKNFCLVYEDWLKRMKVEVEEHPWTQYKTEITEKIQQEVYLHPN